MEDKEEKEEDEEGEAASLLLVSIALTVVRYGVFVKTSAARRGCYERNLRPTNSAC